MATHSSVLAWSDLAAAELIQFPHVGKIVDKVQQIKTWEHEVGAVMGNRGLQLNATQCCACGRLNSLGSHPPHPRLLQVHFACIVTLH